MSIKNFFREWAIRTATKQRVLVDALTEDAPILGMIPMQAASHGLHNVYEELQSITAAQLVDLDDELPDVDVDTKLLQEDLNVIGGTMYVGEDKARKMGGAAAYFNSKLPSILRKTGMNTEASILYNNIRQYAIDNGNVIDIGGSANTNYSILCVKWVPGETIGLFDPSGPGDGKILETLPLSGGDRFKKTFTLKSGVTKDITVFGTDIKTYFGLQLANPRYVSAMYNIDIDSATIKEPTEDDLSDLILRARATPGNSFLYMHPRMKTYLQKWKSSHMDVITVGQKDLDLTFTAWDEIPIVTSYNFLYGTESNV